MNLPNLFLADLPPEATLTPALLDEACAAIRRNRQRWLTTRRTQELIELLAFVAERWQRPDDGFRRLALSEGAAETGYSPATLARGLDHFWRQLTVENLHALLAQDLGEARRIDEFAAPMTELRQGRNALVRGPELLVQIGAGNVPVSLLTTMVFGVLLRSAQFLKLARGATVIPRLFAHSLAELEPKLASCLELAVWPGGRADLEAIILRDADALLIQGSDETLADLRPRVPARCRWLGYGHRISFGFIGAEMLGSYQVRKVAERAAADVTAWDQQGCLSPHLFYVEDTGAVSAEGFAEFLAEELARREALEPRGPLSEDEAAALVARRELHGLRAARHLVTREEAQTVPRGPFFEPPRAATRVWASESSTAWTVVYEEDPRFAASCLNRFIYVKPVRQLAEALRQAEAIRPHVGTVGLAVTEGRAPELALELARWGVARVCPLGRMQEPPLAWRHDGRPALGDLVTWTDWEQ